MQSRADVTVSPSACLINRQQQQQPQRTAFAAEHPYKGKGSAYSISECRVLKLIPVLGSQPAGDVNHKPGGRLPLTQALLRPSLAR